MVENLPNFSVTLGSTVTTAKKDREKEEEDKEKQEELSSLECIGLQAFLKALGTMGHPCRPH